MVADMVPTYHIREADRERDRHKLDEKYRHVYASDKENLGGTQ